MKLYKIGVVLLSLLLLTGCGKPEAQETTTQPSQTFASEPEQLPPQTWSGKPVETPYITLYCPEDWADAVEHEVVEQGKNYVMVFRLTTVENPVLLFSLTVGPEQAEGYYLGVLKDESADYHVYSHMNEQNPEDWSVEDYAEICHQQERVNDLILQLHEDARFIPV